MASKNDDDKSIAQLDNEALIKYNERLKQELEREKKMIQHVEWRGSKLPPFSIEPMAHERQRLEKPMTAEDRKMRKQWLDDQVLAPHEPVYIPELYPRNPIKRFLGKPWDLAFSGLEPVIGKTAATCGRFFVPKIAIAIAVVYSGAYYLKYNGADWTHANGWHMFTSKPPVYHLSEKLAAKKYDDFHDKGFKSRTALRHGKTSFVP